MKKFLTCALCFMPSIAGAVTLYYTPGRECPGLYLNSAEIGCPADSLRVTQLNVTSRADADFTGYNVGNVEIVDSTGNIKSNAVETLAAAAAAGNTVSKVTGNYECQTGARENSNGVCVNALSLDTSTSENIAYIDWESLVNNTNLDSGYEIDPNQIKDDGGKGCYYDRDFDIVIHWCPKNYSAIDYSYGGAHIAYGNNPVDWSALPCNQSTETYHYHWNGGTSLGTYTKNGVTQTELVFPSALGWSPRGLYIVGYPEFKPNDSSFNNIPYYSLLKTIADNLVTEQSTTWGRARLGLPFNQANVTDRIILNNTVNGYGDANANWQIWTCRGDVQTVHMYAAWARDCAPGDSSATCTRQIQRHGLSNPDKGDTMYYTSCTSGTLSGDGTYNPSCGECSATNLGQCSKKDCVFSNAHWCVVGGTEQCVAQGASARSCCVDDFTGCDSKGCGLMGGTWDDTTLTCTGNDGDGDTGDESQEGA
ncbi:MAG: hypothetical protein J5620_02445 [Alphaproteobacteria bacterium]|nr:hypothetical protein [Alphaproteobacteria bacterium]